jgi:hypothetical protein
MLLEDIGDRLLPYSSRGSDGALRYRFTPNDHRLLELMAEGLSQPRYYRDNDMEDALRRFFQSCSYRLFLFEEASYEMAYSWQRSNSRLCTFALLPLPPRSVKPKGNRIYQVIPTAIAKDLGVPRLIEIPAKRLLLFRLSPLLEKRLHQMIEDLAVLSDPIFPEFVQRQFSTTRPFVPFDSSEYLRVAKMAAFAATREIGWHGRSQFAGVDQEYMLEPYWWYRELLFERFIIEVREELLKTLNGGLAWIGQLMGLPLRVEIRGLPGPKEVDEAMNKLQSGEGTLSEIMRPFSRI